jgi:stage V sporulation protein G
MKIVISEIQIIPIKPLNGLVAFASAVINNQFYIGNIAIYTSPISSDGFRLVFPNKKLASGQIVDCFHPITQDAGRMVSEAIIRKYVELMDNFHNVG